jgi:hypothetical protein
VPTLPLPRFETLEVVGAKLKVVGELKESTVALPEILPPENKPNPPCPTVPVTVRFRELEYSVERLVDEVLEFDPINLSYIILKYAHCGIV